MAGRPDAADAIHARRAGAAPARAARRRPRLPHDRPRDVHGEGAVEERDLVVRARRGDGAAFAALVRPHEQVAFRVAYVLTGSAAEAEDAVQEALVKSWRALGRFRDGEPFRPWLLRIVANEARNRRRASGRRLRLAALAAAERPAEPLDVDGLLDALNTLPHDAQVVLACRFLLGLSERETAAALGVRTGTVKSRTSRALDRLREAYG